MAATKDNRRVVLVTGASSGIGVATAKLFAFRGDRVVLAARREGRLKQLKEEIESGGGEALVVTTDLSAPQQAEVLVETTVDTWGRLDVLVNNAGFGKQARLVDMTPEEIGQMFSVNVLSAMAAASKAVPVMLEQGSGSIVNVASVGGVVAHPLNVAYCASKHAMVGFSKSLRLELAGTGVRVTAICPGATRTEFFDVAKGDIPFDEMIDRWAAPPETVAKAIVKASKGNRPVVFPTYSAWFLYWLDRWLPWLSRTGNVRYRNKVLRSR